MNQFFNIERFKLLVLHHGATNKKRYGLSVLALAGSLLIWLVFTILMEDDMTMSTEMQSSTYFFLLFTTGTWYASYYYHELGSKARSINFLMVPAAAFEKFLCSILFTAVLFFIVFTAVFYVVDASVLAVYNNMAGNAAPGVETRIVNVFSINFFRFHDGAVINSLVLFFAIQSVFLFGSVYFKKYSFLKTVISGALLYSIGVGLVCLIYQQQYPSDERMEYMPAWIGNSISTLVLIMAPLFWILTYYRLKLKQV